MSNIDGIMYDVCLESNMFVYLKDKADNLKEALDPYKLYVNDVTINLRDLDVDYESGSYEDVPIGRIELTLLNQESVWNDEEFDVFRDVVDPVSEEFANVWESMYNPNLGTLKIKHPLYESDDGEMFGFVYIDKIIINKEHRGKGLGLKILKDLPVILKYKCNFHTDIITIISNPIDDEGDTIDAPKLSDNLDRFYKKAGFTKNKINKGQIIMYKFV